MFSTGAVCPRRSELLPFEVALWSKEGDGDDGVSKFAMCGCGSAIITDLSCGVAECTAPFRRLEQ